MRPPCQTQCPPKEAAVVTDEVPAFYEVVAVQPMQKCTDYIGQLHCPDLVAEVRADAFDFCYQVRNITNIGSTHQPQRV